MAKKNLKIIGTPVPKHDAKIRVTGEAVYGHDIKLPGMLYGAILRTEHPHATFTIDVSAAKKLPGVICVITADDVDTNNISYKRDHPILKKEEVNCIRDEIAAVAAETKEIAEKALKLIKVKYKIKKGIYEPLDALKSGAPLINKFSSGKFEHKNIAEKFYYEHGNIEEQRKKSMVVVKRTFTLPRMTHACLGTSNITAHYNKTTGKLLLYSSTQVPFLYQRDMAHALKMNPSDIRIIQPVIGGGFGSKLDMYPFEPICALLSIKTGRPVQILYSRHEEFLASPTRQPMTIEIEAGADKDGNFTFRDVNVIKDNGAYTSWGATTPFVIMQAFSSLYTLPACRFSATAIYTNNVFAGSFRGYGNPQATFALERVIDLLADKLGMDKAQIRIKNANRPGETTGQGLFFETCGHQDCLQTVIKKAGKKRKSENNRYRRGMGYASMIHVGGGAKIYRSDGCGTTIKIDPYGYCTIISGSNEIGQGSETVLAMIAAEELGISLDKIKVINTDTDIKPWDVGVHASRTSFVAGNSLLGAIRILKEKLNLKAGELLQEKSTSFNYEDGFIKTKSKQIALDKVVREMHFTLPNELAIASYFYEPSSQFQDKGFKGNVSGTYAFASQAIEVEVDTYTGNVRVLTVHVAQDVGKVLNPLLLDGQIHGGVLQGVGYALTEELIFKEGYLLNPNFHNYKLLTAADTPDIHFYPVETHDKQGPYGAKGVGEAPLIPTAAAIANAVCDALQIEMLELPITPERVLVALKNKNNK
ncbi:MAG: xanthine dehydrogenase family protein molybdopterin-binding subunit [Candidatus Competibacteraceae bacterium]|nr:xanthine dehydrogenase family protein molybdopterin-binding subunit [Candidatus Competibacteraceae bacterium]